MHGTVAAQSASPAAAGQCTTSAALQRQHGQCSEICQQYSPQQQLQLFPFYVSVCWQTAIVTSWVPTNEPAQKCAWRLRRCDGRVVRHRQKVGQSINRKGGQSEGSGGICPPPLSVIWVVVSHVPPRAAAWSVLLLSPATVPEPAAGPGWVGRTRAAWEKWGSAADCSWPTCKAAATDQAQLLDTALHVSSVTPHAPKPNRQKSYTHDGTCKACWHQQAFGIAPAPHRTSPVRPMTTANWCSGAALCRTKP